MALRALLFVITVLAVALCFGWVGCTNETTSTLDSSGYTTTGQLNSYFPTNQGRVSTFQIRQADGSTELITMTAGPQTTISNRPATMWLVKHGNNAPDTSYSVVTDSSVYFYENAGATPERILKLPLQPGNTWDRYTYIDINTGIDSGNGGGGPDTLQGTNGGGMRGINAKSFPTEGANTLRIDKSETVSLSNGEVYAGAVRVSNTNDNGLTNYYWYVPGLGLTKYLLGAGSATSTAQTTGELVSYYR